MSSNTIYSRKRLSTEEFIFRSKKAHGDVFDYSESIYTNCRTKVKIFCKICNKIFLQFPDSHMSGAGCKVCSRNKQKFSTDEFISKAEKVHKNSYNYKNVIYVSCDTEVIIGCTKCNKFFNQTPSTHLKGSGCPSCARQAMCSSKEEFVRKSKTIHGNKYEYSNVVYTSNKHKVSIYCNSCQKFFSQRPNSHLDGRGCVSCQYKSMRLTLNDFINKSEKIHNFKYDYSQVNYIQSTKQVKILCNSCQNIFLQSPASHLAGHGCRFCTDGVSKISTKWLISLNIVGLIYEYPLPEISKIIVDGYDPKSNTVYQFHGDFWHGNPSKFNQDDYNPISKIKYGDLYERTVRISNLIRKSGYNLIEIWESDYIRESQI